MIGDGGDIQYRYEAVVPKMWDVLKPTCCFSLVKRERESVNDRMLSLRLRVVNTGR